MSRFQVGDRVRFHRVQTPPDPNVYWGVVEEVKVNQWGQAAYWVRADGKGRHFIPEHCMASAVLN